MTVLITGASRGIGLAMLKTYRDRGENVIGTHRADTSDGWVSLDVTEPDSHHRMAKTLGQQPIDLLVCNAGVYLDKRDQLGAGFEADKWAATFAANVMGVFLTIEALLPNLRAAGTAKIAIISSTMASDTRAPGGSYIYRSSKAAVLNLGRNLASDLETDGIAVGIYHPGWVITDMGGAQASISVDESATSLMARFDDLSMATTGAFLNWDGSPHPY